MDNYTILFYNKILASRDPGNRLWIPINEEKSQGKNEYKKKEL
jgi:hypothetical protein